MEVKQTLADRDEREVVIWSPGKIVGFQRLWCVDCCIYFYLDS